VTRPWTDAETRRLRALAQKKVSAEDIAKSLGRHAGPVKRKARESGVILLKKWRQKASREKIEKVVVARCVSRKPHGSRLSGVAGSGGLDRREVSPV
jgi:IS30 family transposase